MKKIFIVLIAMVAVAGCGSRESARVSDKEVSSIPDQKDYIQQGVQYLEQSNPAAAIKSFDEAIKQNPMDSRNYIVLGETYMRMRQFDHATDTLLAATRVAPDNGHLYYLLAVNYGLSGDKEKAKINAEKSVALFQKDQDAESLKKSLGLLKGLMEAQK